MNEISQLYLKLLRKCKKEENKLDILKKEVIELVSCSTSEDYCYQKGRVDAFEEILNIVGRGDFE